MNLYGRTNTITKKSNMNPMNPNPNVTATKANCTKMHVRDRTNSYTSKNDNLTQYDLRNQSYEKI